MGNRLENDGISYSGAFAITPASDTEIASQNGLLFDAAGTVTVRFEDGGTAVTLPVLGGVIYPIRVYSVDSIATATTVHGLV